MSLSACPQPVNMTIAYSVTVTVLHSKRDFEIGDYFDYLGGPNVTTRVLKNRRGRQKSGSEKDATVKKEAGEI